MKLVSISEMRSIEKEAELEGFNLRNNDGKCRA